VNVYVDGYNFYVPLSTLAEHEYELAWCNFLRLGEHIISRLVREQPRAFAGCQLGAVKYFTATIPDNMPKNHGGIQRKHDWLDALNHVSGGRVEIVHGTFRPREHRFYLQREELDELFRCGIAIDWDRSESRATYKPKLKVHEEKQTDVMLGCSLVTDAALGRSGVQMQSVLQREPSHRSNTRPTPQACHAAILISADTDFLPAAEMAASVFGCPVAIAFTHLYTPYPSHTKGVSACAISEDELRACMLPAEIKVGDGRTITLEHFKRTHFQRVKAMGG
jgi:hypothetical protein